MLSAAARRSATTPVRTAVRHMSGKDLRFGDEARALMLKGVDQLADAVQAPLHTAISTPRLSLPPQPASQPPSLPASQPRLLPVTCGAWRGLRLHCGARFTTPCCRR